VPKLAAMALTIGYEAELEYELELELELELEQMLSPTRLFTCSAANRASIAAVTGPITQAQILAAVRSAVNQGAREARATAAALRTRPRAPRTTQIFRSIFNVPPTFVPNWRTANSTWRDLGELVALRLEKAAADLTSGHTRYFCWGCTGCSSPPNFRACTTPRAPVRADRHRICLGRGWWQWYRASLTGPMAARRRLRGWMASTLLHEALHIHFTLSHRQTTVGRPSASNVYCYDTLVARFCRREPKPSDAHRCRTGFRP
jgi:hypothetical protein